MGGIVGLIGDASAAELHVMAARMAYRGGQLVSWSPAPGFYLGELCPQSSVITDGSLALDTSGVLYPRASADSRPSTAHDRARLARELRARGTSALLDLRGNFAIAFFDVAANALLLATDPHSYKSLYITQLPGRIAFASDCKALLALADCPAEIDRAALQTYLLTLDCPFERSLLQGVHLLEGARVFELRVGSLRELPRYWVKRRRHTTQSFTDAARSLRNTLETVIAGQLSGCKRIALTLSGGLDSAALLALTRHVRPDVEVATYTVGYGEQDPEVIGARESSEHFDTEHCEHIFSLEDLPAYLCRFIWTVEDPMGREETLLQQAITDQIARRDGFIMAGNGADLAFCGMPRHRLLWLRDRLPAPARRAMEDLFLYTQIQNPPSGLLGRALMHLAYRGDRVEPPNVIGADPEQLPHDYSSLLTYQRDTLADKPFCYHETIDAHYGITMIAPFSSLEVLEFALGCPAEYLIDAHRQKLVLRAAVADLLPPRISRRPKAIQRLRHDVALSERLDALASTLKLDHALSDRGLLPRGYVSRLQRRSLGRPYSSRRLHTLWAVISAELWMRQFIDLRAASMQVLSTESGSGRVMKSRSTAHASPRPAASAAAVLTRSSS